MDQTNYHQNSLLNITPSLYHLNKLIGVASTGQSYIATSENNNLAGVVFAANNRNFGKDFVSAIAHQRFWDRR